MKKSHIILALAALASVSCARYSVEQQIEKIYQHAAADTTTLMTLDKIERNLPERASGTQDNSDAADYLAMLADKEAKISNIWSQNIGDGTDHNIVAELKNKKSTGNVIIVSAAVNNWTDTLGVNHDNAAACVAALKVVETLKSLGLNGHNTVRLLLYQDGEGTHDGLREYASIAKEKDETTLMQMDITSENDESNIFHIGENPRIFDELVKVVPPYLEKYGPYEFVNRKAITAEWPVKAPCYSYNVNKATLDKDIAAIASLIYLLN